MAYADYTFYVDTFGGTAIASDDYLPLATQASDLIDYITMDRAQAIVDAGTDTEKIEAIKKAQCAVAEELNKMTYSQEGIKSERVGDHSITYTDLAPAQLSKNARVTIAAKRYLAFTGLLYRGFYANEYGSNIIP
jgi:phosphohistidine swiveling domain-containing protein